MLALLLLAASAAAAREAAHAAVGGDKTITKVVKLLEGMLEKSKTDGENDRDVYAAYKCYCDKTDEAKNTAINDAAAEIERMTSFLTDKRAQNTKLSQEIAQLEKDIADNEAARDEATTIRDKENADFQKEESDLVTGIDQMDRAIQLLAEIGADATQSGDATSSQLMADDATAEAKKFLEAQQDAANTEAAEKFLGGKLITTKAKVSKVSSERVVAVTEDVKKALRAASLFLTPDQRSSMRSFLQAPFTGNYNAQSGEIVGVLKSMNDTFTQNLLNARQVENKSLTEFNDFIAVKVEEHTDMTSSFNSKKEILGNNADDIAKTSEELETTTGLKESDEAFLADLTSKCATKAKEYQKRVMLRTGEEAAISQAIGILHSDDARDTFGGVAATSTGTAPGLSFVQLANAEHPHFMKDIAQFLRKNAKAHHSIRLAKVAAAVAAENPFTKILEMMQKMIEAIDAEEKADVEKKTFCEDEQAANEQNKADKETDINTLNANIGNLNTVRNSTIDNIATATSDLQTNRDSQATETEDRQAANAAFTKNLANIEEAEKILDKAIKVLAKYYAWLHASQGAHSYVKHEKTDSGGSNIKRLAGKTTDELTEACSALPECVGFNTAGWLKSSMTPEEEWYDWDGGDLYVKTFEEDWKGAALVQEDPEEPETWSGDMEGQRSQGKGVVEMLEHIKEETVKEMHSAIDDERSAQAGFEATMAALTKQEAELIEGINTYKQALADTETSIEEAHENLASTERDHAAIVAYLAAIEPDCTFDITNYETRKQSRESEKAALEVGVEKLEASPVFKNAVAAQEREDLGKCIPLCDKFGSDHAECLACQEDVSVFGYCSQNGDAKGCAEATATSSAGALK
jgi:hypothetical protein